MSKCMLSVIAGVFIGAFALELLNRRRPGLLAAVRDRAARAAGDFRRAFGDGYRSAIPRDSRAA
jgi:hypothetical protein